MRIAHNPPRPLAELGLLRISHGRASRQNQDSRDYRIFKIPPARLFRNCRRLSVFVLGGFTVMAKSATRAK